MFIDTSAENGWSIGLLEKMFECKCLIHFKLNGKI